MAAVLNPKSTTATQTVQWESKKSEITGGTGWLRIPDSDEQVSNYYSIGSSGSGQPESTLREAIRMIRFVAKSTVITEIESNNWKTTAYNRIEDLKALQQGWDGRESPSPNAYAIEEIKGFLDAMVVIGVRPTKILASAFGGAGIIVSNESRIATIEVLNEQVAFLALKVGRNPSIRRRVLQPEDKQAVIREIWTFLGN